MKSAPPALASRPNPNGKGTQRQCPGCNEWITARGYVAHWNIHHGGHETPIMTGKNKPADDEQALPEEDRIEPTPNKRKGGTPSGDADAGGGGDDGDGGFWDDDGESGW